MPRPLHIHVEEPSMKAFLEELLPRVLDPEISFAIINHDSKSQLMAEISKRLLGYANYRNAAAKPKILVLVDRDNDDCTVLKAQLEAACQQAGLPSKTSANAGGAFEVVNRIVIEELEAWYFGDIPALSQLFQGVPVSIAAKQNYRDPDAIAGGTHEQLLRIVQMAGHFKGLERLPKIETARNMGSIINPETNRSPSFNHFLSGLRALVAQQETNI